MNEMFQSPARPFYKSADPLELRAIAMNIYSEFVSKQFGGYGKRIETSVAEYVYNLFCGYTFYMQRTFNEAFASVPKGGECSMQTVYDALDDILMMNEVQFSEIFSTLSENQKRVLAAIAAEAAYFFIITEVISAMPNSAILSLYLLRLIFQMASLLTESGMDDFLYVPVSPEAEESVIISSVFSTSYEEPH